MFGALLTTLFFSLSGVFATRTSKFLGGTEANFWRLCVGTIFLAIYSYIWGIGLGGVAFPLLFVSGCIGFGLGDLCLFQAYPRIGSRLAILIVHCLAAPFATITEYLWLGTRVSYRELGCAAIILIGVALALSPKANNTGFPRKETGKGVFFGVVAALSQALGAVGTRKAFAIAAENHYSINGINAAYQRIIGGVIVSGIVLVVVKRDYLFSPGKHTEEQATKWKVATPWIVANALAGPTLGVSCYQWALKTTPTAIVLPIVALTPLVIVPFAWLMEGEKPSLFSLFGGAVAVAGVCLLKLSVSQ
jgi:drug/metabolite transporter (DMT)-like permease